MAPSVLAWLEPYALAARFSASVFGTAWETVGEAGVRIGIQLPTPPPRLDVVWIAVAVLPGLLVIVSAVIKPRAFCRWLCPSGALLGLLPGRALFKFHIDAPSCTSCGACVACFDCVVVCPTGSARYGRPHAAKPYVSIPRTLTQHRAGSGSDPVPESPSLDTSAPATARLSRGNFMLAGGTGVVAAALALPATGIATSLFARIGFDGVLSRSKAGVVLNGATRPWASPPGSGSPARFSRLCLSCGLCARSCPSGVLRQGAAWWKFPAVLEPYMDYSREFCQFECVACGEACPTGAIQSLTVERKTTVAVAKSKLDLPLCVVVEKGARRGACAEHCPTGAISMERVPQTVFPAPVLDTTLCIGCGACETVCPAEQKKALVVSGLAVHETARVLPLRPGSEAQLSPSEKGAPKEGAPMEGGANGFPF